MPVKYAFAAYKAALPSAIKTSAFERVLQLPNVGRMASSGGADTVQNAFSSVSWSNQTKFYQQCDRLAMLARWWSVLEAKDVDFDPQRFGLSASSASDRGDESLYASSLLKLLLNKCLGVLETTVLLDLCGQYADSFGLSRELVLEGHIEAVLSTDIDSPADIRRDVRYCKKTARASLDMLSPWKRSDVMRRCVLNLEKDGMLRTDYERYSIIFGLYHNSLSACLDTDPQMQSRDTTALELELELIDRRRDALDILSSFYQGGKRQHRPDFSRFFLSLEAALEGNAALQKVVGIQLVLDDSCDPTVVNPLLPLDKSLSECQDTAPALAPLCLPFGLSQGFIHARSLVVRFGEAVKQKSAYPSLENDVVPVLNRLRSHSDKSALPERCAQHFVSRHKEQLACFDLAQDFLEELDNLVSTAPECAAA